MIRSKFSDQDLGEHVSWAGEDSHEIIQGLVGALSPLQTMMKVHEERMATLEEVQHTAQVPVLARRVLAVETSLASLNPSANIEMQTSWLSSVPARLESLESSFAAISDNSDHGFAANIMNHLSDLDAFLACLGKSGENKDPPVSESPERTSIAWLKALPARLRIIESNLAMLGTVYRHWDVSRLNSVETSLEPSFKTVNRSHVRCAP